MDKIEELRQKIKGTEPTSLKKRLETRNRVLENLKNAKENLATSDTKENKDVVDALQNDLESIEQIIIEQLDKIIKTEKPEEKPEEKSEEKLEEKPEEKTEEKTEEKPEEKPKNKTGLVVLGILAAVGATVITVLSLGKMNQK